MMPFLGFTDVLMLNGTGAEMQGVAGGESVPAALCAGMYLRISSKTDKDRSFLVLPDCSYASVSGAASVFRK